MTNPYYLYILVFGFVLIVYQFQWSELYPSLDISLVSFLVSTFAICFILGSSIYKPAVSKFYSVNYDRTIDKVLYVTLIFWSLEFVYNRGIPLLLIFQGGQYEYSSGFGIPSFHVLLATFSSFWTVYIFHVYLSCKNVKILLLFSLSILPQILIFNRGGTLIILSSCAFIYISSAIENLNFLRLASIISKVIISMFAILFVFGALGNIRTEQTYQTSEDESIILRIGQATQSFKNSSIPSEFFWAYIYASSPLANLQATVNRVSSSNTQISIADVIGFVNNEILPDFISKRINEISGNAKVSSTLIDSQLTVSTVYAGSCAQLHWVGMMLMALVIFSFPTIYTSRLKKQNQFALTGLAMLNSLYLFLIFDNMFAFSGLSVQLVYPLLLQNIGISKGIAK